MSRTLLGEFTPRKSRRLRANGYYQNTSDEESLANSETESVNSNFDEQRSKHYHESPLYKKTYSKRRLRKGKASDSPGDKTAYVRREVVKNTRRRNITDDRTNDVQNAGTIDSTQNILHVASTSNYPSRPSPLIQRSKRTMTAASVWASGEGHNSPQNNKQSMNKSSDVVARNDHGIEKNVLDGMIFEKHQSQQRSVTMNSTTTVRVSIAKWR